MQYYCQHILKLEKKKKLLSPQIHQDYYWNNLKFYLFAKKWINLKENRQSDEQILKQFYQNKDFPPRPLGEKAWASHQSLLNQWLKNILELKQGKQSIHISFQKNSSTTNEKYYFWNLCFPNPQNLNSDVLELEQKVVAPIDKFLDLIQSSKIQDFYQLDGNTKKRCFIQKIILRLSLKFAGLL